MTLGPYQFHPSLWPTLAFLLVLPGLIALGFWQLDRAEQKHDLLARVQAARQAEPMQLAAADLPEPEGIRFRRVMASGRYDSERQVLLDNQVQEGRVGYLVLTPLRIEGSDFAVLVNRGWRLASLDRSELPEIAVDERSREIAGLATRGPAVGLPMGESGARNGDWPRRVQYIDFAALGDALPYRLLPAIVDPSPAGNALEARLAEFGPPRHVGYAVQWFALAAALAVLYVVLTLKRRRQDD